MGKIEGWLVRQKNFVERDGCTAWLSHLLCVMWTWLQYRGLASRIADCRLPVCIFSCCHLRILHCTVLHNDRTRCEHNVRIFACPMVVMIKMLNLDWYFKSVDKFSEWMGFYVYHTRISAFIVLLCCILILADINFVLLHERKDGWCDQVMDGLGW